MTMVTERGERGGEKARKKEGKRGRNGKRKEGRERVLICTYMHILLVHVYYNHTGRLNIGDQVLVCDGVSLIDVTHDEAGLAFKQAMDSQSVSGNSKISATKY